LINKRYKIFSLSVNRISYKDALGYLIEKAVNRTAHFFVCFANTHMVVEAYQQKEFAKDLEKASVIFPDGWPVAKAMNVFYGFKQERIAGMDFLTDFLKAGNERALRIFLFGSTENVIALVRDRIQKNFSNLTVAGHICPSFEDDWDHDAYIEKINEANPNFVLVALGCPKQEKWMAKHFKDVNSLLLGIGAALLVFAGVMPRCPKWLRDNGLEWAYRLVQEPRRLFMRYFTSNFIFVFLFVREFLLIKLGIKRKQNVKEDS
jgi:N-acetylglucosaminyldiphosphoundecaprenol N-acetyl-beta-D-mannosaminyltransferase